MIDFFIGRMTVLGRGLVFQPVLVTQTCTYNSKCITLTLQIFHQKRRKKTKTFFKKNITTPPQRERGGERGEREREGGREGERERERERG